MGQAPVQDNQNTFPPDMVYRYSHLLGLTLAVDGFETGDW